MLNTNYKVSLSVTLYLNSHQIIKAAYCRNYYELDKLNFD
jgi:hypothetical protein